VDLHFEGSPKDLVRKFIATLLRLPNLRTLELLSAGRRCPITVGLKPKYAQFPSIREMIVPPEYPDFVRSCPNLESLTFRCGFGFSDRSFTAIDLCGAGLKRVVAVRFADRTYSVQCEPMNTLPKLKQPLNGDHITDVVQRCPKLQEIGLLGDLHVRSPRQQSAISGFDSSRKLENKDSFEHLRRAVHLAVVDIDLIEYLDSPFGSPPEVVEDRVDDWKRGFIDVLKNSSSKDRKFLRWRIVHTSVYRRPDSPMKGYDIVASGELEVFPETSL